MTCDFTSLSTVFQSYQEDGRVILKGCEMELHVLPARVEPGTLAKQPSSEPSELLGLLEVIWWS